jgi:predicted DNA-binding transcriptional regulator AlpA
MLIKGLPRCYRMEAMVNTSDTTDPLWNIAQLSAYLGVPKMTLYRWRHVNYGPQGVRVGRYVRYRRSVVLEWIDHLEQGDGQ